MKFFKTLSLVITAVWCLCFSSAFAADLICSEVFYKSQNNKTEILKSLAKLQIEIQMQTQKKNAHLSDKFMQETNRAVEIWGKGVFRSQEYLDLLNSELKLQLNVKKNKKAIEDSKREQIRKMQSQIPTGLEFYKNIPIIRNEKLMAWMFNTSFSKVLLQRERGYDIRSIELEGFLNHTYNFDQVHDQVQIYSRLYRVGSDKYVFFGYRSKKNNITIIDDYLNRILHRELPPEYIIHGIIDQKNIQFVDSTKIIIPVLYGDSYRLIVYNMNSGTIERSKEVDKEGISTYEYDKTNELIYFTDEQSRLMVWNLKDGIVRQSIQNLSLNKSESYIFNRDKNKVLILRENDISYYDLITDQKIWERNDLDAMIFSGKIESLDQFLAMNVLRNNTHIEILSLADGASAGLIPDKSLSKNMSVFDSRLGLLISEKSHIGPSMSDILNLYDTNGHLLFKHQLPPGHEVENLQYHPERDSISMLTRIRSNSGTEIKYSLDLLRVMRGKYEE